MNRPLRALIGLAAGAALLSTAGFAAAQDRPAAPPMAEPWKAHMHEQREAHAHVLRDILNIRPDQEAAFQAFLASMAPLEHAEHSGPEADHAGFEHMTTPQRLDRMAARMAEHQAAFQRHVEAVKRFYGALTPEQQRAFDALTTLVGHHGFGETPEEDGMRHMGPMGMEAPDGPR